MDLTANQAASKAAAILERLDDGAKRADRQAAVASAWLDLARYLREQEQGIRSAPSPREPGSRIHPDAFTG